MPLTLSNPETDQLARSLAALTGETVEMAVERALRERLAREGGQRPAPPEADASDHQEEVDAQLLHDVHAIARRFQEHIGRPFSSLDHGAMLYDEAGLPR